MKVIGIEIDKKRAICVVVERDEAGNYANLTGKVKFVEIKDDHESDDIKDFFKNIHAFFDDIQPDKIAVISRQTKGKFAAAAVSFKLEALIQCYQQVAISFVSKQTLTAYYKKNALPITYDNAYQEHAARLANYVIASG